MELTMAEERRVNRSVVRLMIGDITDLEIDAFVYYARPDLVLGSGFGTAMSTRGGPAIQKDLEGKVPLATGKAVASTAGNLKAKHIIHAVGPTFQEEAMEEKLRTTMLNSLRCAEELGVEKVAFPAMGVGFYGVPLDLCARVMLETIKKHLEVETRLNEVTVCVLDIREYRPFEAQFGVSL